MLFSVRGSLAALLAMALLTGCAAPPGGGGAAEPGGGQPVGRKSLTIALEGEVNALATELDATGVSGLQTYVHDFLHNYLTIRGDADEVLPQLAAELPSVDAGTLRVSVDGRMEVTWKLRRGVLWHDGTEFTSADVKFGYDVTVDPAAPLGVAGPVARSLEAIDTPDPYTAVAHWRETSRFAGELGRSQINVLPRHLLEADFSANKEGFAAHPYFTDVAAVIGTGAYRASEWSRGSHLTAEAFDRYWQGRAKIDRVTFRFIRDHQTALANMLAGSIDVANRGLSWDGTLHLEREFQRTGGRVQNQPTNYRHLLFQFRPEQASPADLLDPRVRKALSHAIDREQMVEGIFPGAGREMASHSIGYPGTPIGDVLERNITKYPFDLTRAAGLMEEAGWRKGSDGMLAKGGNRFQLEFNAVGGEETDKTFALTESEYRKLGVDLSYRSFGGRRQTPEDSVVYPGLQWSGFPINHRTFTVRWDGRQVAAPENRYSGGNRSGYVNPILDRIFDNLERSLRFDDELRYWGDAWSIITGEPAVISLFFVPQPIAARKGVEGVFPANASGSATWRLHTWDITS